MQLHGGGSFDVREVLLQCEEVPADLCDTACIYSLVLQMHHILDEDVGHEFSATSEDVASASGAKVLADGLVDEL